MTVTVIKIYFKFIFLFIYQAQQFEKLIYVYWCSKETFGGHRIYNMRDNMSVSYCWLFFSLGVLFVHYNFEVLVFSFNKY